MAEEPEIIPKVTYSKISSQTREQIITCIDDNRGSLGEVARIFGIPYATIWRIWKRYENTGEMEKKKRGGYRKKK